jgi:nitroreductase
MLQPAERCYTVEEGMMARVANVDEVIRQINRVRQVRQYRPDAVPEEIVSQLLEIARWTGSSRNTQPWHFIAITDKEQLRKISQVRVPINWVADAPLAVAIVLDNQNPTGETYDEGRVSERLLIGAHLLGLGGGVAWFGDAAQEAQAKEILGIPAELAARSVVALGYPKTVKDPRPNPVQGGRRPISEIVSRDRMG